MRWMEKPEANTRIVRRFALFPIKLDKEYRWLEVVYIYQIRKWDRRGRRLHWQNVSYANKRTWEMWRNEQNPKSIKEWFRM